MSGGSMNYLFHHIEDASFYVKDEEIKELLSDLAELLHDLEWYESGDYGKEDYDSTLRNFKKKWFGENRNYRLARYITDSLKQMENEVNNILGVTEEEVEHNSPK